MSVGHNVAWGSGHTGICLLPRLLPGGCLMISLIDVTKSEYRLFTSIAIETSSLCNRRCKFCPVSYAPRGDEYMDLDLWHHILQQLADLKYNGRVELYVYNEPYADNEIIDRISDVRRIVPRSCIMISTNGDLVQSHDIRDSFDAGLNQLCLNYYSSKCGRWLRKYAKESGYERYDMSVYQNIGPRKRVVQVIDKTGMSKHIDAKLPGVHHISNRAGNIPDFMPPTPEPLSKVCCKPFRFLNIMYDGKAMLCCNDYYQTIDVGDANEEPLVEIWNKRTFNVYRLHLQRKCRKLPLCDACNFAGGYYTHMLHHVTFGGRRADESILMEASLQE